MIILVFLIFTVLAVGDFPSLVHAKKWREVTVLSLLYLFVLTFAAFRRSASSCRALPRLLKHLSSTT